jgi:hypothetical protein
VQQALGGAEVGASAVKEMQMLGATEFCLARFQAKLQEAPWNDMHSTAFRELCGRSRGAKFQR